MHTVSWTGNKSCIPYHGPAIHHTYRVMDRQYIIHTVSWTGNKSYIPYHGPAINHAYRVVTKSLHATTLKNGSHFARGNSCVLRLAFILRWGQRSFLFHNLYDMNGFSTYSIWLMTPITEWYLFWRKRNLRPFRLLLYAIRAISKQLNVFNVLEHTNWPDPLGKTPTADGFFAKLNFIHTEVL